MKTLPLPSGARMPVLGLGTWKSEPGQVGSAVFHALSAGYRHLDCAAIYGNEVEVGEALAVALAEGVVAREELFVTSKLWNDSHAPEDVLPALRRTLADLRLERLDLYLVHWPVALRKGVLLLIEPEEPAFLQDVLVVDQPHRLPGNERNRLRAAVHFAINQRQQADAVDRLNLVWHRDVQQVEHGWVEVHRAGGHSGDKWFGDASGPFEDAGHASAAFGQPLLAAG